MKTIRSPAREALALAIQTKSIAAAEATRAADALRLFDDRLGETRMTWWQSKDATTAARARRKDLMQTHAGNERAIALAAAHAGELHPDEVLDAAVKAEAKASELYEEGKAGHRRVMTSAAVADENLAYAAKKVGEAADLVKHEIIGVALAQAKLSHRQFERDRSVLQYLVRNLDGVSSNMSSATAIALDVRKMLSAPIDIVIPAEWLAAGEALLVDPDAAFPT